MGPRPNLPPNQLASRSKLVPQEIEDGEITKPPVTTVFVGSISDRAPDNMIRTLLQVGIVGLMVYLPHCTTCGIYVYII